MPNSIFKQQYNFLQALNITSLVMQNTSYSFCLIDRDLKLVYWSRELQQMTGLSDSQVNGARIDLFLPFLEKEIPKLEKCLQGTSSSTDDILCQFVDRNLQVRFQIQYIPLKLSEESATWGLILFKNRAADIEIQKQLMESEDRFRHMADSAPVLLWLTKEDGMCTYFNQSWLAFRGRSLEQEIGFGWAEGIHPDDFQKSMHKIFTHFNERKPFEAEYRLKNKDGEYRWIMARGIPRYGMDDRYAGFTGSCIDITEHKNLINELQAAKQAADNANIIKTQFLANVSHEIRTPLGIILGFAEIIRNENVSEEERHNLLDRILKSGNQLLHIIDDVLDVSKVEANKIELEQIEFSLPDMIKEIRELFELRAQEKGLLFKTAVPENLPRLIKSDPTRMRQILTNIIGNSFKFTSQGEVALSIHSKPMDQKRVCLEFEIKDTGVGLKPESRDRIFKPFSQVDASTTRKFGGTGLGLHLSRKLAQILGGDLRLIDSKIDEGSVFSFSVPVEVVSEPILHAPTGGEQKEVHKNLQGLRILIVDDAEENRILLGRYLQPYGVSLDFAFNGEEATEKCKHEKFDLVLMDIQMPVLDGYGALAKIREFDRETPIIALTAHALKTERDRCLQAGFAEHVAKPVNKQKLVSYISSLFSQRESNIMSKTW